LAVAIIPPARDQRIQPFEIANQSLMAMVQYAA
jgi:hypothetical protein